MTKRVFGYFKCLILLFALMIIPTSCGEDPVEQLDPSAQETPTPEDPEPEPEPVPEPETPDEPTICSDSVMVSFVPQSLEWSTSPISRASNDDLYGVTVYQSMVELDQNYGDAVNTITAFFDDPNIISLKLAKSQYYHFIMVYIPNGKNIIEKIGDGWGFPFYSFHGNPVPKLNSVGYYESPVGFVFAPSQVKGIKEGYASDNSINEVLRYMGIRRNFKPVENNQKIDIQLYRWQYGIKITASDFNEGSIKYISTLDKNARVLSMEPNSTGTSSMEHLLEFPTYQLGPYFIRYDSADEFADNQYINSNHRKIIYTTPNGEEIVLWSSTDPFPFKRMKMHTLEFSLSDAIANGGIAPDLMETEDTPMEEVGWIW